MYHDNDQMVTDVSALYVLKLTKCKNVFRNLLGLCLVLKANIKSFKTQGQKNRYDAKEIHIIEYLMYLSQCSYTLNMPK